MLVTSVPVFAAFFVLLAFVREAPKAPGAAVQCNGPQLAPGGGYGGLALITASYMGHMCSFCRPWCS